ncbi:hypothetical protein CRENBAI_002775 [Crenichthys baileyi]|uniref:Circularly permutated Ras protein 1 n=1 Tax=Crenichthys baileyi TaxID=28760 RepID=A0AAV9QWF4_9TELE
MEFACGFVYVPPSLSQREVQRSTANVAKRSALLPPVKHLRPRTPPPPPPTQPLDPKVKVQQSAASSHKISEQLEKSPEVFHRRPQAASSPIGAGSPVMAYSQKTALLPLYVKSTSNTDSYKHPEHPHGSSDTNNPTFDYNRPKYEPESNMDNLYSYTFPEGSADKEKLPPDSGIVSVSRLTLPPRPSFMHLTPEYVMVLPSPVSTPASPQMSPSPKPPLSTAKDKESLLGNPNVVLISLGKLLSEERERSTHGEPKLCSQCGSVLDSRQKDEVKVCYFCQFGDLTRPPSLSKCPLNGQKDELFLLNPHEHPLSGSNSLLLFCIDSSGSMSITSKVIICTDGKANAKLGNLEEEDNDARTLLSSSIFYQDLGESAANQGVTVSVLSIEGTDCRLDELGRLADRTGGKVVIASPNQLHSEFEEIIQDRTIATHCAITLLLPKSLRMKGEREAGHKGTREVGNVNNDTEVTIQFVANEDIEVVAPASGSRVFIQLQIRYKKNGQALLRVFTAEREVTDDSSAALSSLSLPIVQLNLLQTTAALAVRGRFLDARKEGALQQKLIQRAIEHNQSAEDEQTYQQWIKTMEPINNNIHTLTRRSSVISDSEPLTDAGAALLITMKHSNRKSISLKDKHRL